MRFIATPRRHSRGPSFEDGPHEAFGAGVAGLRHAAAADHLPERSQQNAGVGTE
jgi:hypothetical protein